MRANGRASVSARRPQAFGICDRDGFRYNLRDLSWQNEWAGTKLQNTRFLVCRRCLDKPNEQLRAYAVPPDPLPVRNPRPDQSYMGNPPLIFTTAANVGAIYELDGFGNLVLDGFGNPIIINSTATFQQLLPADASRYEIDFDIPPAHGIFVNATGGAPYPNYPGSQFYAPGGVFQLNGAAAQSAINIFTTIAGLTLVVQTLG